MGVVHIIIASQTTEVGNNPFAGLDFVIMKRPTLPLGKREGHLEMHSGEVTGFERGGTFGAIEIVVEA